MPRTPQLLHHGSRPGRTWREFIEGRLGKSFLAICLAACCPALQTYLDVCACACVCMSVRVRVQMLALARTCSEPARTRVCMHVCLCVDVVMFRLICVYDSDGARTPLQRVCPHMSWILCFDRTFVFTVNNLGCFHAKRDVHNRVFDCFTGPDVEQHCYWNQQLQLVLCVPQLRQLTCVSWCRYVMCVSGAPWAPIVGVEAPWFHAIA
jgi:hypothetical protein